MCGQQVSGVRIQTCHEFALNVAVGVSKLCWEKSGRQHRTESNNTKQSIV